MTVFIHVGLHKTGSTFLQSEVFPKLEDVNLISFYDNDLLKKDFEYLQSINPIFIDENRLDNIKKYFFASKKKILVSSEQFSGNFSFQITGSGGQFYLNMEILKKIFPDAKIVIIFRNQLDLIISHYKDEVAFGVTTEFNDWLETRIRFNGLNYLFFDKTINYLRNLFGRENVIYDFYENILFDKSALSKFLSKISHNFKIETISLENKRNVSLSNTAIRLNRFTNRLIKTKLNSQSYTGNYDNLKAYNFLRYKFYPFISRYFPNDKNNKLFKNNKLDQFLKKLSKSNKNFFKIINIKIPKEYDF